MNRRKSHQMHQTMLRTTRAVDIYANWSARYYAAKQTKTLHAHKWWKGRK